MKMTSSLAPIAETRPENVLEKLAANIAFI